jgi:hypothetical protein
MEKEEKEKKIDVFTLHVLVGATPYHKTFYSIPQNTSMVRDFMEFARDEPATVLKKITN